MNNKGYFLPASILIAALLISGSVIYTTGQKVDTNDQPNQAQESSQEIEPITEADHIRGAGVDAPVKIVEYSDPECPYCSKFHLDMKKVIQDYGDQVAWVYRHFPLDSLHSKARKEITATECAYDLGDPDIFWGYLDRLYEVTPSNNGLDLTRLPEIAEYVGLDADEFNECLESGKFDEKIEAQYQDAVQSGGTGTPYVLVMKEDEVLGTLPGALPYEQLSEIIDQLLNQ
ncbi:MAG TPA: DsbA family protein [Candidatus Paceibacterota bacterium]|nr:DsbA family protein [Candidatus Paceibacterota bacterium]